MLTPLRDSFSLNNLAYNQIKDAILTFKFLPNQALIEGDLAAQLGISKTPVRDALLQLEQDGLVERIAFKGTYVSGISNQDMANTYQIRIVLEGLAARMAAELLSEADLVYLEDLIGEHEQALAQENFADASRMNSDFHNHVIQQCGNPRLIRMLDFLDDNLKRYRLLSIAQGLRKEKSIVEHRDIFAALRSRDAVGAETCMHSHLNSAINDLNDQNFEELWHSLLKKRPE
ncbi:MAG: GntR family transcriptional regulator [Anaerolineaceae bacterium]